MSSPRLPRFNRADHISPIQLTARDLAIIRSVYRHRFLRSSHIAALVSGSAQQVLRRLQLLYHHRFLERPRAQLDFYRTGGSSPMVYGLGTRGAAFIKSELGPDFQNSRWGEEEGSVGRIYLDHALLVSDFMVAVELACRKFDSVRFLFGDDLPIPRKILRNRPSFRWSVKLSGGPHLGVMPDRVFGLEYTGQDGITRQACFFLEADRATMPVMRQNLSQTSFYRKILAYQATWSQSIHRNQFRLHRFRVLTVTTSPDRLNTIIHACSQLKRGHGLFLFADTTILEKPEEILRFNWRPATPGQTGTLLD